MSYFDLNRSLTDEDNALRDAAHQFARDVMRPIGKRLDAMDPNDVIAADSPLWDFFAQAYELGYHRILIPEGYGGLGVTPLQVHLIFEELAWGSGGLATALGAASFPFFAAALTANDDLVDTFVRPFCECTDGSLRGCWGITEPDHGSDLFGAPDEPFMTDPKIRGNCQARRDGDEWVINGQKAAWVSNGTIATHSLLFCQVDPSMGMMGGGVAIVPLDLEGVSRGSAIRKIGARDLNQGPIFFDDVRIPAHYMIAEPDSYRYLLEMILAAANMAMGIFSAGGARAAFEEAFRYAQERIQGGVPLIQHRSMRRRLFELFSKVEMIRSFSRAIVDLNFNIVPPLLEYSLAAKTMCTQLGYEVAHEAIQIHGGNGLTEEYEVEKLFRDARAALIGDGCNESLQALGGKILQDVYPRQNEAFDW